MVFVSVAILAKQNMSLFSRQVISFSTQMNWHAAHSLVKYHRHSFPNTYYAGLANVKQNFVTQTLRIITARVNDKDSGKLWNLSKTVIQLYIYTFNAVFNVYMLLLRNDKHWRILKFLPSATDPNLTSSTCNQPIRRQSAVFVKYRNGLVANTLANETREFCL